jgi:hypothetical protein
VKIYAKFTWLTLESVRFTRILKTDTCNHKTLNIKLRNFKDNKPFIGTTRYASIAAHKGYELGRKDDLESMIYVLLFFLKGILPW